jgi:hypothetical protein
MIVQRRKPIVTPLDIIRRARAGALIDEDGNVVTLELLPGLSRTELQEFAEQVPSRIPPEIAELLRACRGFYGTLEQIELDRKSVV